MLNLSHLSRALTGTLLALALSPIAQAADGTRLDGIAAVVNDQIVLLSELDRSVEDIRGQILAAGSQVPPDNILRTQVLERLVMQKLQVQLAENNGVQIPDDLLNETLGRIAEANGITLNQLPATLASEGIDYRYYREQLRIEMMIDRVRRSAVDATVYVSPEEVDSFLAQQGGADNELEFRLSHILIAVAPTATDAEIEEAAARARDLAQQARDGADFQQLAISSSQGQRALQGGDLGWRRRNQIPAVFAQALNGLNPGDVTEPMRSASGFHILKMEERRQGDAIVVTQAHIRHILIQPNEVKTSSDAQAQLQTLRQRIVDGSVSFSDVARQYSDDPVSASRGGDLGWNSPGTFLPEFETMVASAQEATVSQVFQTQYGWHILEVLERRQYDGTDEYRRNEARQALYQQKVEEATQLWMRALRDEAYMEPRI